MALTDESNNNGFYMPVAPAYGNGYGNNSGFGSDGWWLILLLLCGWGGMGMGGFGGGMMPWMMGGMNGGFGWDFPWLLNGQNNINSNTNNGFRDAMLNDGITSIRDGISGLSTQLCGCCGDMQMALANGFNSAEIAANSRQMANMQTAFNSQTAITGGLSNVSNQLAMASADNRLGIANLAADISRENCADREALNYGVRDIVASQTAGFQRILDKLCDQELQAERRDNANLRSELMYARGQASQVEQTARILAGQAAEIDGVYNRLKNCPVNTVPVFGNQPIFTCPTNVGMNSCGCGCGGATL